MNRTRKGRNILSEIKKIKGIRKRTWNIENRVIVWRYGLTWGTVSDVPGKEQV